jgi:glycosyltransferase involved in cell wall biosynthesis
VARIALVHDIAGVAKVQARLLREAGHEVDQIPLSEFGASWRWPVKAIAIPLRLVAYLPIIARLRSNRYDIVHIHWLSQGIVGVLLGRQFFAQSHGSDLHVNMGNPLLRLVNRSVLKRAKMVFYVTPNLVAYAPGFESKFVYLPNPVGVEEAAESPPPARLARAVIFTRLDPVKGVDQIFPAAERLGRSVELTALDWGPLASEYVPRYSPLVRFVRPVPHDEIGTFLGQFDIVIGQMHQGILSLSELEAMAAGRPLITGIDWSFYPDDPPPVIAATNPDDIAGAVERLKNDAGELARLSREGREWVRRNHGFARHLHVLEGAYFGAPTPISR